MNETEFDFVGNLIAWLLMLVTVLFVVVSLYFEVKKLSRKDGGCAVALSLALVGFVGCGMVSVIAFYLIPAAVMLFCSAIVC